MLEANERGKQAPRKIGMAPVQREGLEYEFTVVLNLTSDHIATVSKDRTGLFDGQYFTPTVETGQKLLEWIETGEPPLHPETKAKIERRWLELAYKLERINAQTRK